MREEAPTRKTRAVGERERGKDEGGGFVRHARGRPMRPRPYSPKQHDRQMLLFRVLDTHEGGGLVV